MPPVRSLRFFDTYSMPSVKERRLPQTENFQCTSGPSTIRAACEWPGATASIDPDANATAPENMSSFRIFDSSIMLR